MSDGMPDYATYNYVRDPNKVCVICLAKGCAPIEHLDEVLSDDNAERLAKEVIADGGLSHGRAQMLARYVLSKNNKTP